MNLQKYKILVIPFIYISIFVFYEFAAKVLSFIFDSISKKIYSFIYNDYDIFPLDTFIIDLYLYWIFIFSIMFFLYYKIKDVFYRVGLKLTIIFHLILLLYLIYMTP